MDESFASILFDAPAAGLNLVVEPPSHFADLNLDQAVDAILDGREEYDLKPFFYTPLKSVDAVAYRHEVLRDLEREQVADAVGAFAGRMRDMRRRLEQARKLYYERQKQAWFLDAVDVYCQAVRRLADALTEAGVPSRGLRAFRDFLAAYVESPLFRELVADTKRVNEALSEVRYCLEIKGNRIRVTRFESEPDYAAEIEATFERFRQGAVRSYLAGFPDSSEMNHVEAAVLELVAELHPERFAALAEFRRARGDYLDPTVARFDREIQFYLAYLEQVERLRAAGLELCYPRVSRRSKEIAARESFDLALAIRLVGERSEVVPNDFALAGGERIVVVTGPNQGGKTTFARMFGQLHHLAAIGCLVPGADAQLYLPDRLYTHFEREEEVASLRGKLEDDLRRIHRILEEASSDSVVVMNESLTSTTLADALLLGRAVMERLIEKDLLGVYVTFVDELASLGEATVSMVSTVVPDDPATRTFKIVRRPADGRAYAAAIARKYGLTYDAVRERLAA